MRFAAVPRPAGCASAFTGCLQLVRRPTGAFSWRWSRGMYSSGAAAPQPVFQSAGAAMSWLTHGSGRCRSSCRAIRAAAGRAPARGLRAGARCRTAGPRPWPTAAGAGPGRPPQTPGSGGCAAAAAERGSARQRPQTATTRGTARRPRPRVRTGTRWTTPPRCWTSSGPMARSSLAQLPTAAPRLHRRRTSPEPQTAPLAMPSWCMACGLRGRLRPTAGPSGPAHPQTPARPQRLTRRATAGCIARSPQSA
mmetsp:Transcript_41384/g.131628  ORF Transcript_41384/g.131628 Transcript_41384/m.131628 type:complete len:251 (-) Transcript_41384:210-962(-)